MTGGEKMKTLFVILKIIIPNSFQLGRFTITYFTYDYYIIKNFQDIISKLQFYPVSENSEFYLLHLLFGVKSEELQNYKFSFIGFCSNVANMRTFIHL